MNIKKEFKQELIDDINLYYLARGGVPETLRFCSNHLFNCHIEYDLMQRMVVINYTDDIGVVELMIGIPEFMQVKLNNYLGAVK